jgi:hypothetical protein
MVPMVPTEQLVHKGRKDPLVLTVQLDHRDPQEMTEQTEQMVLTEQSVHKVPPEMTEQTEQMAPMAQMVRSDLRDHKDR